MSAPSSAPAAAAGPAASLASNPTTPAPGLPGMIVDGLSEAAADTSTQHGVAAATAFLLNQIVGYLSKSPGSPGNSANFSFDPQTIDLFTQKSAAAFTSIVEPAFHEFKSKAEHLQQSQSDFLTQLTALQKTQANHQAAIDFSNGKILDMQESLGSDEKRIDDIGVAAKSFQYEAHARIGRAEENIERLLLAQEELRNEVHALHDTCRRSANDVVALIERVKIIEVIHEGAQGEPARGLTRRSQVKKV
jgi:hypothetical protein